jgi:hypothetical protein
MKRIEILASLHIQQSLQRSGIPVGRAREHESNFMKQIEILATAPLIPSVMQTLDDTYLVHRLWEASDRAALLAGIHGPSSGEILLNNEPLNKRHQDNESPSFIRISGSSNE